MGQGMKDTFIPPIIFKASNLSKLQNFLSQNPNIQKLDHYQQQLLELHKSRFPKQASVRESQNTFITKICKSRPIETTGNWVYFPWRNSLVHLLTDNLFQELRLSRNYPLIRKSDQQKFYNLTIGIVGLSVGNSIAQSIIHSGGGKQLKIADPDTLDLSNLNRIRASVVNLGQNKTHLTAQQIYEVNPYAKLSLFDQGIQPSNLKSFLLDDPPVDLLIDEADDLVTKHYLRLAARALGIPLIMTTDNGYESNTSILRFDLNKNIGNLNNACTTLDEVIENYLNHPRPQLTEKEKLVHIAHLLKPENICPEMQTGAMMRAEEKIAGWPQLAMTVFLGGGTAAYAALRISSHDSTPSTPTTFSLIEHFNSQSNSSQSRTKRLRKTNHFINYLQSIGFK